MDQHKENNDHGETPLEENRNQTRRAALKKIAVGGGIAAGAAALPSKWTKPIADRVMIPAHAQTSQAAAKLYQGPAGKMVSVADYGYENKLFATARGNKVQVEIYTEQGQTKSAYPTISEAHYKHAGTLIYSNPPQPYKLLGKTGNGDNCNNPPVYMARVVLMNENLLKLDLDRDDTLDLVRVFTPFDYPGITDCPTTTPDPASK